MYIWIHDKYSSTSFKQRLWQRKIVLIWQFFKSCVSLWCSVQGVACTCSFFSDKLCSTPGDSVFCFLYRCFFLFGLFFFLFFLLAFFLYSYCWPCWSCTWINMYLSLSPEFYFGKMISKALDLHTGQAYDQIKTISPVKTCPSSETAEFSQC